MDEVDNPNLAGGPIGGSDIAVYKVKTSYILGEVHSFPYALTSKQIKAINTFTKVLDEDGVTNEILNWIYDNGIPTGTTTTQQPPTSDTLSGPIDENIINQFLQFYIERK